VNKLRCSDPYYLGDKLRYFDPYNLVEASKHLSLFTRL
jgi:hypothetical protein